MGLFSNQFANVVEWEEYRDDVIFWKWTNREIKKDSKLIIKPGQDAIFLYNGAVEGIFTESGNYTIDSQIIPFLSTLKGFKFGFNSGLRAEVLFVNTKEFTCNWGTSSPIRLQAPGLPGGLPVRSNGKFSFKIDDYNVLIEKVAKTQERMNKMMSGIGDSSASLDAFSRMEAKADAMLDKANAMSELNSSSADSIDDLASKYDAAPNADVQDELAALKAKMGL